MRADDLRRHLDSWWRDKDWPEPVLHKVERIRARLEAESISPKDAAAELLQLQEDVGDPTQKGRLILAASQVAGDTKVVEMKRR